MRTGTVSYRLEDLRKGVIIPIGFVGENDFTRVYFDSEEIYKNYPEAQVSMKVQPPKGSIYPATVTREENTVIWQVKAADLAHKGSGELQLTFTIGNTKIKTYIARTDIKRSLEGNGTAPDPVQDWVDHAEDVLEEVEAAEIHQPIIGLDGYWYTWNQETGEYEKTNTKAQGADGHSPVLTSSKDGKTTTIYADGTQLAQIQDGEDGQGADVIDDTAGEGDTDKTWSADKLDGELTDVKNAIQGKQDAPETAGTSGQVLGLATENNEVVPKWIDQPSVPSAASSAQIKSGADTTHFITSSKQDESLYYALSKLAGVDLASGSDTVGVYSDASKVAIQKMLGIYEAPWELIREDTVTNATDANIDITVDGNGNSFELTDVRLMFCSPVQETQFIKGDYGKIKFGYGTGSDGDSCFIGAYTQAANASRKISYCEIEQKNGMIKKQYTQNATNGGNANIQTYVNDVEQAYFIKPNSVRYYNKVIITNVTGTAKYKLYGKRKWN